MSVAWRGVLVWIGKRNIPPLAHVWRVACSLHAYTAAAGTNKKNMIMLKFPLYLDEAYHKKYTEAAAKQQNKAEEVQNMSKIPTLNIDRAESRHPEKIMYIVAAE